MSMTSEKYAETGGGQCPVCGSVAIEGSSVDIGGDIASQEIVCQECSANWTDVYRLVGYSDLFDLSGGEERHAHTVKDNVIGEIKASGPCTLADLVRSTIEQCVFPGSDGEADRVRYNATWQVVFAINELTREGKIELYDTGDAWDVV